jgi:hypothetical protein
MNYSNEDQVLRHYEMTDSDGTDHKEAPCDGDVVIPGIVILNVGTPGVVLRSRSHSRPSQ